MPTAKARAAAKEKRAATTTLEEALLALERASAKKVRDEMGPRYGIVAKNAFGTPVGKIRLIAKSIGRDHALAAALWETQCYEARMLAAFVADPKLVTKSEMDRWARDFDNWAICDTACFHLFDKTPHAFAAIERWAGKREEFVKRAAFALLASVALHDKNAGDEPFLRALPLIETAADDERNFVKKGVSWALRGIGKRKSPKLRAAAMEVATRLAASKNASARWIGKDVLREFGKASKR